MKPKQLKRFLMSAFAARENVLIKGRPGVGKSDIVAAAAKDAGCELIISHPVVSDPVDYKGMPHIYEGKADFIPFGELRRIIDAKVPTVFFLDDLGQASPSVQSACMQLLLARRINEFKVSDQVTFVAATNRREDKANVNGILEPVKSRFASIVELNVNSDDWCEWAARNEVPHELISFIRFRPDLIDKDIVASKDIVNSPSPRTLAALGRIHKLVDHEIRYEAYSGAVGEAFATEYIAFLTMYNQLPSFDDIVNDPSGVPVPSDPGLLYALSGLLANKVNKENAASVMSYVARLPIEIQVAALKSFNPAAMTIKEVAAWFVTNGHIFL